MSGGVGLSGFRPHRMERFPHASENSFRWPPRSGTLVARGMTTSILRGFYHLLLSSVDQLLYDLLAPYLDAALQGA